MKYILIRRDRPGRAEQRAKLQPAHVAYQEPFLKLMVYGGGLVREGTDTSGNLDIRYVTGNVIVFEADRETVEEFHRNDPYTREDMFEFAIIEPIWQRVPAVDAD
ncbi:MAG: YciI family protein [Pseudomonadota bacterium]|nr:YciI family protein [Pseudomonadota bacterium]